MTTTVEEYASEIVLSRIAGFQYPESDLEDALLACHFLHLKEEQPIRVGDIIYCSSLAFQLSTLEKTQFHQPTHDYIVHELNLYPFFLEKIVLLTKDNCGESSTFQPTYSKETAILHPSKTKVKLNSSTKVVSFQMPLHEHIIGYVRHIIDRGSFKAIATNAQRLQAVYPLVDILMLPIACSVERFRFKISSSTESCARLLDIYLSICQQSEAYHLLQYKSLSDDLFQELAALIMSRLHPSIELSSISANTIVDIMTMPILVDIAVSGDKALEETIRWVARKTGNPFVEIEAKLLSITYNNSKRDRNKVKLSLHENMCGSFHPLELLGPTDGNWSDFIKTNKSCIIFIKDIDCILESSIGARGINQISRQESYEDSLIEAIENMINASKECLLNSRELSSPAIIIASTNNKTQAMKSSLKRLFQEVKLKPLNEKKDVVFPNNWIISPGAYLDLESYALELRDKGDLSTFASNHLANAAASESLQRIKSDNWLSEMGFETNPKIISDSASNKHNVEDLVIEKKDSLRAIQYDCSYRNITASARSRGDTVSKASAKISSVQWQDIGGLDRVRQEILDVLELPFKHPDLFPVGSPRRHGVLLYGPPGTGKTLVARAVATECKMTFLSIKGPELLDSYVGESEKNVRDLFARAKAASPCVLFFDEIDSLAPSRAKGSDSGGGVMDRIVSQLLTEMDQVFEQQISSGGAFVFVIAATNRPDLLDPAFLRPGRFDRKIYLGVSKDAASRRNILIAQTRKFSLAKDVNFEAISEILPCNATGADIGSVSTAAYTRALERKLSSLEVEYERVRNQQSPMTGMHGIQDYINLLPEDSLKVEVSQEDFMIACQRLVPSTTDLNYYEGLRDQYNSY